MGGVVLAVAVHVEIDQDLFAAVGSEGARAAWDQAFLLGLCAVAASGQQHQQQAYQER